MVRVDKYGRGSAAANGEGFVDLAPGDTFAALEKYAIEAVDIMKDERLEVHLAAKPRQFKTARLLLEDRISYYIGDVNRTRPKFVGRDEPFSVERTGELLEELMQDHVSAIQPPTTNHQSSPSSFRIG